MKILGGHDYYDGAMQFGVDDSVVFVRDNRALDTKFSCPRFANPLGSRYYSFTQIAVIVGDKLYQGLEISGYLSHVEPTVHIWTVDAFKEFMNLAIENRKGYLVRIARWEYTLRNSKNPEEYFGEQQAPKEVVELMHRDGLAIIAGRVTGDAVIDDLRTNSVRWEWNGNVSNLKSFGFYKVIDPYTMYQTLDMWVSGVLASAGNRMVEITDNKVKIEKHGFDTRTSFRKPKAT